MLAQPPAAVLQQWLTCGFFCLVTLLIGCVFAPRTISLLDFDAAQLQYVKAVLAARREPHWYEDTGELGVGFEQWWWHMGIATAGLGFWLEHMQAQHPGIWGPVPQLLWHASVCTGQCERPNQPMASRSVLGHSGN